MKKYRKYFLVAFIATFPLNILFGLVKAADVLVVMLVAQLVFLSLVCALYEPKIDWRGKIAKPQKVDPEKKHENS
jgi:hypothetical protein